MVTFGSALGNLGRGYQAFALIQGGLDLAERHGQTLTALRARLNLGALPSVEPGYALENNRRGMVEARRMGHRRRLLLFLTNGAEAGLWMGDWDWALPELDKLLAADLEPEDRLPVLESVARLRGWKGERVDAYLEALERLADGKSDPASRYSVAAARADHAFALGDLQDAAERYRRAAAISGANAPLSLTLAARAGLLMRDATAAATDLEALQATAVHGQWNEAHRTSIRAGLAALGGRTSEAVALYADAIRVFRDLGVLVDEAFTAIEMATLLDPELPEVRAAADAARETLARLGAQPFLERLEAAMHRGTMPGSQMSTADRQPRSASVAASATPA